MTAKDPIGVGQWTHVAFYQWVATGHSVRTETRLGVNGRVVARTEGDRKQIPPPPLVAAGNILFIAASPEGREGYRGVMDDIRVTAMRRYCIREQWPQFDPGKHPRPIPFGPPLFEKDQRLFHFGFEGPRPTVHPLETATMEWKLGTDARLADFQVDAPFGKALLVDPAMGFPRIPIQGMSPHQGTLELWFQPFNWDNNTVIGERTPQSYSMVRFYGRDKRNGKTVQFMSFDLPRESMFGGKGWCQPGTWSHFAWGWSPEDVLDEDGWGNARKGDPVGAFRGIRFGELVWRAMLRRNVQLIDHVEPLYAEIGVDAGFPVYHGQRPAILIDEIIYHPEKLPQEDRIRSTREWAAKHHPEMRD
jgi:hypothetical protein